MSRRPFVLTLVDGKGAAFLAVLAALAVLVPLSNLLLPPTSAFHVPTHIVVLVGKWLTFALLALSLGVANKFLEPYAGAVLGKILLLVLVILFIQKRPRGLFALKGRAVEA